MNVKINLSQCLAAAAAATLLQGCVGYNRVAFATKSNVGLDFDTQPVPTMQVNISRKEMAIEPTYEGGQTPPLLASFGSNPESNVIGRFAFGVNQTFSGGDAAIVMAKLLEDPTVTNIPAMYGVPTNYDSKITVSQLPEAKCSLTPGGVAPYQAGQVTPFVFATETGLGVKVNWTGTSGQIPDAVHIGFRRKEGALAPIFATPTNASGSNNPAYNLKVPSFVATVDNNVQIEGAGAKTGTIQFFATGDAATFLAMHKEVRQAMIKRLDSATHENANPEAAAKVQQQQSQADQISAAATETGTDNVDVSKLTQIANNAGVGDPSKFAAKYTGKKAADLNKDLKGKYSANVGAMYQNLNK